MPTTPSPPLYDLVVIGGGINGVGIAADAAGRGLSVFLCEQDDLASHTSSASSKLIHGGLRYLEHFEFRLVHEALAEREVLLAKAPHIIKPMRFVLPHRSHLRPAWLIRAGLFLYDNLGKRERLPGSRAMTFGPDSPLKSSIRRGFEYSDCWVDDARLVVLNAMSARENGAHIHTRTRCLRARRAGQEWLVELEHGSYSKQRGENTQFTVRAQTLVNAAGPWVAQLFEEQLKERSPYGIRLIQGSHIIVPRLYNGEHAYIMQHADRRIVFAIPYLDRYTLIGTTDREYEGDPAQVQITDGEIDYLLGVANSYFRKQLQVGDIAHAFAGVRPLCEDESDDPSAVTRDYTLSLSADPGQAPLLSVFGGKLTTYRKLAEAALAQLKPYFPNLGDNWTATALLPGGEGLESPQALATELSARITDISDELAQRWATTYGTRIWPLIGNATAVDALGEHFGAGLYAAEVDYLCREEWATGADDILWRRTKLGLALDLNEQTRLERYIKARQSLEPLCR